MKTVVCLPTYNEEESLQTMIDEMRALNLNLFIVDEHSMDKTLKIAQKNNVPAYQRDGSGKGWGVRKAIEIAKKEGYENLALIDCDCTYPPKYIPQLAKYLTEFDMVVGRRKTDNMPLLNRLGNKVYTYLVNVLFFSNLKDINSGLRIFKLNRMPYLDAEKFDIEVQITTRALKNKLTIKEIPIEYFQRKGNTKVRMIKDGFIILSRIFKERFTKR